jgi:hypothetical protein
MYSSSHLIFPIYFPRALRSNTNLNESNARCKFICWANFILKTLFKSYCSRKGKPSTLILAVAEPPELFRLKYASHRCLADTNSTHFKRNNPLVCRVSTRYHHGSTGSKQVYLARRRVYNHSTAHQLLNLQKHKYYYYKAFSNLR